MCHRFVTFEDITGLNHVALKPQCLGLVISNFKFIRLRHLLICGLFIFNIVYLGIEYWGFPGTPIFTFSLVLFILHVNDEHFLQKLSFSDTFIVLRENCRLPQVVLNSL